MPISMPVEFAWYLGFFLPILIYIVPVKKYHKMLEMNNKVKTSLYDLYKQVYYTVYGMHLTSCAPGQTGHWFSQYSTY